MKTSHGPLERFFKMGAQGSNLRTEVMGGVTTFMTMAYALFVNSSILGSVTDRAGFRPEFRQVLTSTALSAAISSTTMGVASNYPFCLAAGMGLNALGASLPLLVVSMIIFTAGEMVALPVANSYIAGLAPDEMRGRYQGISSISWSCATMTGPALGIALWQFSPALLWMATLIASATAAILMLASRRFAAEG